MVSKTKNWNGRIKIMKRDFGKDEQWIDLGQSGRFWEITMRISKVNKMSTCKTIYLYKLMQINLMGVR